METSPVRFKVDMPCNQALTCKGKEYCYLMYRRLISKEYYFLYIIVDCARSGNFVRGGQEFEVHGIQLFSFDGDVHPHKNLVHKSIVFGDFFAAVQHGIKGRVAGAAAAAYQKSSKK